MTPETRTAAQILTDIARLEGELATLKGEPLLIEDGGFKVRECPLGGATFTLSWCVPEDANYTEWYPTVEAAKAKLALFARTHKRAVSDDGFYVDLTAQGCQDSRAYVTRRQVPQRRRIYGGDTPLHQRDSVRGGEFLRRIVEKVQQSPHKLYEFGTLLDERPDSGAIAVVELCDADSDVYYSVALWYADAETARRCLDQQYGLQDGAPKPALERPDSEVVFWWDGRVYDLDAGQFPVWLAGLYDREDMPAAIAAQEDRGTITIQSPDGYSDFYAVDERGVSCGHKHATDEGAAACAGLPAPVDVTWRDRDEDEPSVYDRPFPYPEDIND